MPAVGGGQGGRKSAPWRGAELLPLCQAGSADNLFLPFTDLTSGHGSYGDARYLDLRLPPAGRATLLLDFNRAYNPSCTYHHAYSCPVPPAENRLRVAVPAGVRSEH